MGSEIHFLHLSLPCGVVNQPRVKGMTHTDRMTGKWWQAAKRRGAGLKWANGGESGWSRMENEGAGKGTETGCLGGWRRSGLEKVAVRCHEKMQSVAGFTVIGSLREASGTNTSSCLSVLPYLLAQQCITTVAPVGERKPNNLTLWWHLHLTIPKMLESLIPVISKSIVIHTILKQLELLVTFI